MASVELTDTQRAAVEYGEGPLLLVAGAGSGKTLVITHRIAHLIRSKLARPEEILAVTFTEKAAAEMSERIDVLLPYGFANCQIQTFHAFGDRILREFALDAGLNPDFQVLSQAEQVIFFREHLFDFPLKHYRPLSDPTRFIRAMLNVLSRAKDENVSPSEYRTFAGELLRDQNDDISVEFAEKQQEIAETYQMLQDFMITAGKVDFGDQVTLALRLIQDNPSILSALKKRFRFFLIDEFQDTNYAQFQLIRLLGGESANITVVGDDDQAIYKFRGAAISNILDFMQVFPEAVQIVLKENFRSTQVILDTAYRLINHNNPDRLEVKNGINKRLIAQTDEGFPVEHIHCDTLTTEADQVAAIIEDLKENKNIPYGDMAILVRANRTADPFIRGLNMKDIPWRFSGNRGLYDRPEIKLLVSFLKTLVNPNDSLNLFSFAASEIYQLSMADLYRCLTWSYAKHRPLMEAFIHSESIDELSGLSNESRATIKKVIDDIKLYQDLSRNMMTGVLLYQFLTRSGLLKRLTQSGHMDDNLKVQNIARFFDVIWSFSQVITEDRIFTFVNHLQLLIDAGDDPATAEADLDADAVNILTVHKAKGLEWRVVFLVSLINQRFPHSRRSDPIELPEALGHNLQPEGDAHLQEERRLFYVGMTRAKERLYLTSARDYGGVRMRKVSPFVLEALDRPQADTVTVKSNAEEKIHRFRPSRSESEPVLSPISSDSIVRLSYFQIDDILTCPLKYKYVHVLRVPILPHHTVVYGKALHSAIETYHRQKMLGIEVSLDSLYD
ncbi:hypothetical protein BVY01_05080, partial [bacterium I07]